MMMMKNLEKAMNKCKIICNCNCSILPLRANKLHWLRIPPIINILHCRAEQQEMEAKDLIVDQRDAKIEQMLYENNLLWNLNQ